MKITGHSIFPVGLPAPNLAPGGLLARLTLGVFVSMSTQSQQAYGAACSQHPVDAPCYVLLYLDSADATLVAVDPTDGDVCDVATQIALNVADVHGMSQVGDALWMCAGGVLTSVALSSGSVTGSSISCSSVASSGDDLLLLAANHPDYGDWYADALSVTTATPDAQVRTDSASMAVVTGDSALLAKRTGGMLAVRVIGSSDPATLTSLEGFDAWAWGFAVRDGEILVLDDGRVASSEARRPPSIRRYSLADGHPIGAASITVPLASTPHGLVCPAL